MSMSMSTATPILTRISIARITERIWKHVGKGGKGVGNMTPVTGRASHIEIKGQRSASTEAAMRAPRHHGRLFVAERRVGGKISHGVASVTGAASEVEVVWVTGAASEAEVASVTGAASEAEVASVTGAASEAEVASVTAVVLEGEVVSVTAVVSEAGAVSVIGVG
jgi:hypothetical protein